MVYDGKWIVFEGPDFSGTTTQIHCVAKKIFDVDKGHLVLLTREPTMRKYGREIRRLQLNPDTDLKSTGDRLLELYAADRKDHMENVVLPALRQGIIVLSDRSVYSTLVYQGIQGKSAEDVWEKHQFMEGVSPDIALVFDIDVDTIKSRMGMDNSHKEVWDALEWQQRAIEGYANLERLVKSDKHNIIRIDGRLDIEEVTSECWEKIFPILPMTYDSLMKVYSQK